MYARTGPGPPARMDASYRAAGYRAAARGRFQQTVQWDISPSVAGPAEGARYD